MRSWLPIVACGCALALACGGGGVPYVGPVGDVRADASDAAEAGPGDQGTWETGPGDLGQDPRPDGGGDGPGDGAGDTGDVSVDAEAGSGCPGGFGCACVDNSECLSGYCTDTMEGRVCTVACATEESCPQGWSCLLHAGSSDVTYVCTAPWRLCQPCRVDADCEAPGGQNVCIEQGPQGWFCGTWCSAGQPCPEGYDCVPVDTKAGPVEQCMPAGGAECPCTKRFIEKAYLTTCERASDIGTCRAERTCDEPCPAPFPSLEACNGADDDCDGHQDEDVQAHACDLVNAYGTCPGTSLCVGGKELCQGTYASQEVCNDIDDDCDGETDEPEAIGCDERALDADGDGWGVTGQTLCVCAPSSPYTATKTGDCDDGLAFVNPGMAETCNAMDDDCDGDVDEGFQDLDRNGKADCAEVDTDKDGDPDGSDCAPLDPDVHHKAPEACNGLDDNCSGVVDEGFPDLDLDGTADCLDDDADGDGVPDVDDCAPQDPDVHPGAQEQCDGQDDDCDGAVDEVCGAAEVVWENASCSVDGDAGDVWYAAGFGVGAVSGAMPSAGAGPGVCMGVFCLMAAE